MKKILFFGRKEIGERCLDLLLDNAGEKYTVAAICSNAGTDVWWKTNNIYKKALERKIPFIPNEKRNEDEILRIIKSESIDTLISLQHIWILSDEILQLTNYRALNLHNAKLPDYKGYFTGNHAIINNDKTYTSTVHWMIKEVDEGAMAFEETFDISEDETAISLYNKSCEAGIKAFAKLVDSLSASKEIPYVNINGKGHFYAKKDLDNVRVINDPKNNNEIDLKARGLFFPPFEPAYYKIANKKIYVLPANYKMFTKNLKFLNNFNTDNDFEYVVLPNVQVKFRL